MDAGYERLFVSLLSVDIILVTLGLLMALYMIVLGFRAQACAAGRRLLRDDALVASWAGMALRFAWIAAALVLLFALKIVIQRVWPSGTRRHRVLGRLTLWIYGTLFVTGSLTYAMLYILYPGSIA